MRALALVLLAFAPVALHAQDTMPASPPPAAADSAREVGPDPVGFLLEHKDTLHLSQPVVDQLVRINLDLFRRTRRIQRTIDSIVPPADDYAGIRRARQISAEQREVLAPLLAARRAELLRAHDAAWELLTVEQRESAERLAQRAVRGRRPNQQGF